MPYCEIQTKTESRSAALKTKDDIRAYQERALRLFVNVEREYRWSNECDVRARQRVNEPARSVERLFEQVCRAVDGWSRRG
jgi:hypothetical protein